MQDIFFATWPSSRKNLCDKFLQFHGKITKVNPTINNATKNSPSLISTNKVVLLTEFSSILKTDLSLQEYQQEECMSLIKVQ